MDGRRLARASTPGWLGVLPNLLTIARLALAAALPFAPRSAWTAIVVAAGLSDFLDGYLARRLQAFTRLGAWMDAVADKVCVLVARVTLAVGREVAWWQVPLVLARDLAVVAALVGVMLHREWAALKEAGPRLAGKLTTGFVFAWFVAVLVAAPSAVRTATFVLAAGTSLLAAVDYFAQAMRISRGRGEDEGASRR
jgi:cardiolipin synthase